MINAEYESQAVNNESIVDSILLVEDSLLLAKKRESTDSFLKKSFINSDFCIRNYTTDSSNLVDKISQCKPKILIMNINKLGQNERSEIAKVNQLSPLPIIIFTKQGARTNLLSSIKATVIDCVSDEIKADRLNEIILLACKRFKQCQLSRNEFEQTKIQLVSRKLIERAQGLIMQQKKVNEKEADLMLRKMSIDNSQTIEAVAQNIISVCSLLKQANK